MRRRLGPAILCTMGPDAPIVHPDVPRRVHVAVQIDVGSDPLSGVLSADGGPEHEFSGWLDLAAALEQVSRDGR